MEGSLWMSGRELTGHLHVRNTGTEHTQGLSSPRKPEITRRTYFGLANTKNETAIL